MEIAFNISARALFGDTVVEDTGLIEIEDHKTGEVKMLSFYESVVDLVDGSYEVTYSALRVLFPTLFNFTYGEMSSRN